LTVPVDWAHKIIMLLGEHHIASLDNRSHFVCMLKNEGRVVGRP